MMICFYLQMIRKIIIKYFVIAIFNCKILPILVFFYLCKALERRSLVVSTSPYHARGAEFDSGHGQGELNLSSFWCRYNECQVCLGAKHWRGLPSDQDIWCITLQGPWYSTEIWTVQVKILKKNCSATKFSFYVLQQQKNVSYLMDFLILVQFYIQSICKRLTETLESHWEIKLHCNIKLHDK